MNRVLLIGMGIVVGIYIVLYILGSIAMKMILG